MKRTLILTVAILSLLFQSCDIPSVQSNTSAIQEQSRTETNQRHLNEGQPSPKITWSLERDNLIKRFKLQNDRGVLFYMYVFIEGQSQPVGYYQINKVSSVNSQLTNPEQIISGYDANNRLPSGQVAVIPSPAEDGSYGENGMSVFGFTPDDVYIETNMKYIVSTIPLSFKEPVNKLAIINTDEMKQILEASKKAMQ